ncbi:MAG: tetratricopeptide repeat protein [Lachnospiraceae bacterium]|nr:tetratricopeptide repeat protein [Lachnospiraceae bacterium]
MFCTNCGKKLENGANFCSGCGERVVTVDDVIPEEVKEVGTGYLNTEMKKRRPVYLWIGIIAVILVTAVVITTVVIVSGAKKSEYDEKMDLGRKYLLELDYKQAALAFEEAIKIDPKKKDAYIELAEVYVKQGENEKAILILESAKEKIDDENERKKVDEKKDEIEKIINKDRNDNTVDIPETSASLEDTTVPMTDSVSTEISSESTLPNDENREDGLDTNASPIPTPVLENEKIDEAFQAYLKLVKKKKSSLDVLYANWDKSAPEVRRQTVAVLDVWGDETPELILAEAKDKNNVYNPIEPLTIYTYESGKAKVIFERNVENTDSSDYFIYYDLIYTNDKELYLYEVQGCDRGIGTWSHLFINGKKTEKIIMTEVDGYEAAENLYNTYYNEKHKKISEKKFNKWKSVFDESVKCSIFSNTSGYGDPIGMNYDEALSFLKNYKKTGIIDGIEWYEKNYYKIGVKRLTDEISRSEYSLLFLLKYMEYSGEIKKSKDNTLAIELNDDIMTRLAANSSYQCRGDLIKSIDYGEGCEYFYSIDSDELKREGVNLFGKALKPSYLSSDNKICYDAYTDSNYGPVIYIDASENETGLEKKNFIVKESGNKYIVTRAVYFGYWGYASSSPANTEIIYTIEESKKSDYGYIVTGIKIKYLDE